MSTVKHAVVALILACFHQFMERLENLKLSAHVVLREYVSTDAASLIGYWMKTSLSTSQIEHISMNIYQLCIQLHLAIAKSD